MTPHQHSVDMRDPDWHWAAAQRQGTLEQPDESQLEAARLELNQGVVELMQVATVVGYSHDGELNGLWHDALRLANSIVYFDRPRAHELSHADLLRLLEEYRTARTLFDRRYAEYDAELTQRRESYQKANPTPAFLRRDYIPERPQPPIKRDPLQERVGGVTGYWSSYTAQRSKRPPRLEQRGAEIHFVDGMAISWLEVRSDRDAQQPADLHLHLLGAEKAEKFGETLHVSMIDDGWLHFDTGQITAHERQEHRADSVKIQITKRSTTAIDVNELLPPAGTEERGVELRGVELDGELLLTGGEAEDDYKDASVSVRPKPSSDCRVVLDTNNGFVVYELGRYEIETVALADLGARFDKVEPKEIVQSQTWEQRLRSKDVPSEVVGFAERSIPGFIAVRGELGGGASTVAYLVETQAGLKVLKLNRGRHDDGSVGSLLDEAITIGLIRAHLPAENVDLITPTVGLPNLGDREACLTDAFGEGAIGLPAALSEGYFDAVAPVKIGRAWLTYWTAAVKSGQMNVDYSPSDMLLSVEKGQVKGINFIDHNVYRSIETAKGLESIRSEVPKIMRSVWANMVSMWVGFHHEHEEAKAYLVERMSKAMFDIDNSRYVDEHKVVAKGILEKLEGLFDKASGCVAHVQNESDVLDRFLPMLDEIARELQFLEEILAKRPPTFPDPIEVSYTLEGRPATEAEDYRYSRLLADPVEREMADSFNVQAWRNLPAEERDLVGNWVRVVGLKENGGAAIGTRGSSDLRLINASLAERLQNSTLLQKKIRLELKHELLWSEIPQEVQRLIAEYHDARQEEARIFERYGSDQVFADRRWMQIVQRTQASYEALLRHPFLKAISTPERGGSGMERVVHFIGNPGYVLREDSMSGRDAAEPHPEHEHPWPADLHERLTQYQSLRAQLAELAGEEKQAVQAQMRAIDTEIRAHAYWEQATDAAGNPIKPHRRTAWLIEQ